jgi:hypothetical protein
MREKPLSCPQKGFSYHLVFVRARKQEQCKHRQKYETISTFGLCSVITTRKEAIKTYLSRMYVSSVSIRRQSNAYLKKKCLLSFNAQGQSKYNARRFRV